MAASTAAACYHFKCVLRELKIVLRNKSIKLLLSLASPCLFLQFGG